MNLNKKILGQSGIASIMFAIFMAIILTLLAIGFAVLSRNDQRQTLDKTLSNQANYAAESAINLIQSKYKNNISYAENNNCAGASGSEAASTIDNLKNSIQEHVSTIDVTCLTWNSKLKTLWKSSLSASPWVVPIIPESGTVNALEINWSPIENPSNSTPTTSNNTNLTLTSGNLPTLRIAGASTGNIANTAVAYINPGPSSSAGSGSLFNVNGSIFNAKCTRTDSDWKCSIKLSVDNWGSGVLSITSLNGSSDVSIKAYNGSTELILTGAQAKIDATAKSQDVIKRLIAYVPLTKTTWQPSFVASADKLCKNYRVDGNNGQAGPVRGEVCP